MTSIVHALQQLDLHSLENLAGQTIVRAVRSAYDTNRERALARLVVDRFGTSLLQQPEIRRCLIEQLAASEAVSACEELGIPRDNAIGPQRTLQLFFDGSFTHRKAEQFQVALKLPVDLLPPTVFDERQATEIVQCIYGEKVNLKGYLHPYQKRVKDEILVAMSQGYPRQMVQMPTGSGKTVTALEVVVDLLRAPRFDGLIVWVVDSNELAEQALQSFKELWKVRGDSPTRAYRFFKEFSADFSQCEPGIVFAGFSKVYAALTSRDTNTREQLSALSRRAKLVIVDEAHTSIAETYEQVIRELKTSCDKLIGLSATPGRIDPSQRVELSRLYGQILISLKDDAGAPVDDAITYLRRKGYLAEIVFEELTSSATSTFVTEGEICSQLAEHPERNAQIINQIKRAIDLNEASIVFACTKDHVLALVALCRSANIEVGFIIGETPQAARLAMLDRFRSGDLKVLLNHEILSSGIDLPNVDRLIITRPIGSPILYSQVLGRALRGPKNGGNSTNTVVNIRDNLQNFPTASHVYESFRMEFTTNRINL